MVDDNFVVDSDEITGKLQKLVSDMRELGCLMQQQGLINEMAQHGRELISAAVIAENWLKQIDLEQKEGIE